MPRRTSAKKPCGARARATVPALRLSLLRCHRSFQLRDALRVGCIGLSTHFFTLTMEKREMLKLLDDEMRNFCILVEGVLSSRSPHRVWD